MALESQLPTHIPALTFFFFSIFTSRSGIMSRYGKSPRLDLKLHLSLPVRANTSMRMTDEDSGEEMDVSSDFSSSPSSCVSSEAASSPEVTSMVLAGCPRCLMYVMLPGKNPRCPKCKSTVLLDFLNGDSNDKNKINNTDSNKKKS